MGHWDAGAGIQHDHRRSAERGRGLGSKNGFFYLLDAQTGGLIYSVSLGIHLNTNKDPTPQGEITYPGSNGGINTYYTYDPSTNMVYATAFNSPDNYTSGPGDDSTIGGGLDYPVPGVADNSTLYAIDASTGGIAWTMSMQGLSGGASSSNDLVFTADAQGNYYALDAETGSILWTYASGMSDSGVANWGPPSVADGMLFETSYITNGGVVAFALPGTTSSSSTTASTTSTTSSSRTTTSGGTSQLTVLSANSVGNAIAGYYTALYDQGGDTLGTGYTPSVYALSDGAGYQIEADSYEGLHVQPLVDREHPRPPACDDLKPDDDDRGLRREELRATVDHEHGVDHDDNIHRDDRDDDDDDQELYDDIVVEHQDHEHYVDYHDNVYHIDIDGKGEHHGKVGQPERPSHHRLLDGPLQ